MNPGKRPFRWNLTLTVAYACVFLVCAISMHIANLTALPFGFYAVVASMPWSFIAALATQSYAPGALDSDLVGNTIIYGSGLLNTILIYTISTFVQNRLRRNRLKREES